MTSARRTLAGSPRRRQRREPPEPLETDDVRVVAAGTVLWALAFVGMLPFYGRLASRGHGWWVWTALTGVVLGGIGIAYCRRRRAAIARSRRRREEEAATALREPFG